ncbi:hypothetical protein [Methylopila sp. 73B]|uniref:hypothetical protein n=1 Tax=Methylopila sp. 73B TaxID=1120792 RepID=UPI0003801348|nr:hypothetical protein [Methylopila sp. 73B]
MAGRALPPPPHPRERLHDRALTSNEIDAIARSHAEADATNAVVVDGFLRWIEEDDQPSGALRCPFCGRLHGHGLDAQVFTRRPHCHGRQTPPGDYRIRWHAPSALPPEIAMELALPQDSHLADGWWCRDHAWWMRHKRLSALTSREESIVRGILYRYCRSVVFRMALCERLDDFPEPDERKRAMRELIAEVARRHGKGLGAGRVGWARRLEIAARALHHAAHHGSLW